MTILVTAGTGKVGTRLAQTLAAASVPYTLASRRGPAAAPANTPPHAVVKFDWLAADTFDAPFAASAQPVSAVMLIAPHEPEPAPAMVAFIDRAREKHGVRRFVLLGHGSLEVDSPFSVGPVWKHLRDVGVEYCVLRPTWFMENFIEGGHYYSIKNENRIYTATGDGKIPFISAVDIAAIAFRALTDKQAPNTHYDVLGPELLTHDQIAEKLSSALGRKIDHYRTSLEEQEKRFLQAGLPEFLAKMLTFLEDAASKGSEENLDDAVERVTGRAPANFDAFLRENKQTLL